MEGIIIDITYYQFENNKKNLPYIGLITPWHESFDGRIEEIINPEAAIIHWLRYFEHTTLVIEELRGFLRK